MHTLLVKVSIIYKLFRSKNYLINTFIRNFFDNNSLKRVYITNYDKNMCQSLSTNKIIRKNLLFLTKAFVCFIPTFTTFSLSKGSVTSQP